MMILVPVICALCPLTLLLYGILTGTITYEVLGVLLSIAGLIVPVLFFFIQWLDETADRIDRIERQLIKNTASIEYFGKFQDVRENISFLMRKLKIEDEDILK